MIKFTITSRHKPEGTTEQFYYEWAVIHVALMLGCPMVMKTFARYAQHFGINGVPDDLRVLPRHPMNWESFADHLVSSCDEVIASIASADYLGRMRRHSFSDSNMELGLWRGEVIYEQPGFHSGEGVKLVHSLKKRAGESLQDFTRKWARHAAFVTGALKPHGLTKYAQAHQLGLDPAKFRGSLFEFGGVDQYAGLEEFWFEDLDSATRLGSDRAIRDVLRSSYEDFMDIEASHSLFMVERVVFDFVTPGERMPPPAIFDPASLEARVFAGDWTKPEAALRKSQSAFK